MRDLSITPLTEDEKTVLGNMGVPWYIDRVSNQSFVKHTWWEKQPAKNKQRILERMAATIAFHFNKCASLKSSHRLPKRPANE